MDLKIASRTDVGRVRTNNEDSMLVDETGGLFIVCDGMGGHAAGEVASSLACEVIRAELDSAATQRRRYSDTHSIEDLEQLKLLVETAVQHAGREIFRRASRSDGQRGMGTTCTAVLLADETKAILAHVGDSRLYLERRGRLVQLSEDHTYVGELVARGALTAEQALTHPQSNVLSRALGVQPSTTVDCMIFDLDPGDTLLLCSDGLHNYYPDEASLRPTIISADLVAALDALVDGALQAEGHDNITGILIRIMGEGVRPTSSLRADERIALLQRIPMFGRLSYNETVKLLGLMQHSRLAAGQTIFTQGDPAGHFYVLMRGEIEIIKDGATLLTLQAGGHLGERALINDAPRDATAVARSDAELLDLSKRSFDGVLRDDAVMATKLLWSLLESLGATRTAAETDEIRAASAAPTMEEIYVKEEEEEEEEEEE